MSIKQEFTTEPRVIAIKSWVQCDGCGSKMSEQEQHSEYGFRNADDFKPSFDLMTGWLQVTRGSFANRSYAHCCPKCSDSRAGELLSKAIG